jgi:nitrogen fixation/metabolism regulation signal transduction histidine kinase
MLEAVFDPYMTSLADGTGLGLPIVKKIVMEHGGFIEASRSDWGGARLIVWLPRIGSAASFAAQSDRTPQSSRT